MSVFATFATPGPVLAPGARLPSDGDVTVELERVVPVGSGAHYLWIVGDDRDRFVADLQSDPTVAAVNRLDEHDDRVLVRVDTAAPGTPVFNVLAATDALLVGATGTGAGWRLDVQFPDRDALAAFQEACRDRGVSLSLDGVNESGFGASGADLGLTPLQRETLALALAAGYFDVPRGTTVADLAVELGVSEQAVSERIRRGLSRFLDGTLDADGAPESSDVDLDG